MSGLIPAHFATGRFSYHVKVLITYSLTVGSLALLVLAGLMLADGGVAPRRLVTVSIACLFAISIPMMRFIHSVNV